MDLLPACRQCEQLAHIDHPHEAHQRYGEDSHQYQMPPNACQSGGYVVGHKYGGREGHQGPKA